jgi:hypothetical protein
MLDDVDGPGGEGEVAIYSPYLWDRAIILYCIIFINTICMHINITSLCCYASL